MGETLNLYQPRRVISQPGLIFIFSFSAPKTAGGLTHKTSLAEGRATGFVLYSNSRATGEKDLPIRTIAATNSIFNFEKIIGK